MPFLPGRRMKRTKREFLFFSLSLSLSEEYMVVCEAHFGKAKFASMLFFIEKSLCACGYFLFSSFLLARTARNYRRLSGQMKASLVERTEQTHLRSVSTVLATLPGSTGKQRGPTMYSTNGIAICWNPKKRLKRGIQLVWY